MKEFLKKLVRAESTAEKGELAAARIISEELRLSGITPAISDWGTNRANITAWISSTGRRRGLLFACHLDVVGAGDRAWKHPPFAGVQADGKIYGRGTADMKGGIAAIVTAIREIVDSGLKLQGDIVFFAGAGEETDSCGAKRFIRDQADKLPPLCGVIVGEPTDFEVVTAHRGLLWLEVTSKGTSAHSSTPELGVNAIGSMGAFLAELENYQLRYEPHELLGRCTMSVNTIQGGNAMNIVPERCSIGIDIRTLPRQNHQDVIDDMQEIFDKLKRKDSRFDAEVSIVRDVGALETDRKCDFVKDFCSAVGVQRTKAVGFTTDGPYFASLAPAVVVFGPGKPQLCHRTDEYIEISDVEKAVQHYKNLILKFLV